MQAFLKGSSLSKNDGETSTKQKPSSEDKKRLEPWVEK